MATVTPETSIANPTMKSTMCSFPRATGTTDTSPMTNPNPQSILSPPVSRQALQMSPARNDTVASNWNMPAFTKGVNRIPHKSFVHA
jgi:hypothetical protein